MASELETFAPSAAVRAHPVLGGLVEDFTAAMVTANDRLAFAQKAPVHWEAALHAAQTSVDSAASVLKSIELDMRGAPVAVRAQMNEILPEMRQALSRKRALVERTREKSQRENLSLDRRSDDVNRQNLKAMGQLQAQSTERLENSRRQLSDIENVGGDIMIDLRRQRDVLQHSKANLEETDNWIASSGRVLRSMAQQTMCMSALWWFIVLVLLAIIGIIIYVKFIRTK